jgi:hypothetical protein
MTARECTVEYRVCCPLFLPFSLFIKKLLPLSQFSCHSHYQIHSIFYVSLLSRYIQDVMNAWTMEDTPGVTSKMDEGSTKLDSDMTYFLH